VGQRKVPRVPGGGRVHVVMDRTALIGVYASVFLRFFLTGCLACGAAVGAAAEQVRLVSDGLPDEVNRAVANALPDESPAQTALEARRQAKRAAERVRETLNSEGYLDPEIDFAVETDPGFQPLVRIKPGPRFTIAEIALAFDGTKPREDHAAAARAAIEIASGDRAIASRVLSQQEIIVTTLRQAGHAFAEAGDAEVMGDRDSATISVTYRIDAGPRIRFGEVRVEGEGRTRPSFIRKLSPVETGEIYTPDTLAAFNSRLAGTRLFSLASARLAEDGGTQNDDGTETRDVVVIIDERPRHTITLGGRWSTSEGAGVTGSWTRRNLTGRGDSLVVEASIAQLERSLEATWRRPAEFGYGRNLSLNAGLFDETTDAYDRRALLLGANLEFNRNPRFTYNLGANIEVGTEEDAAGERDIQVVRTLASARIDQSNDPIDATRGWRAQLSVAPTQSFGSEPTTYLRNLAQVSAYVPFGERDRVVLAGRLRAGGVFGGEAADIPVRDRFYAGGGGSIRGFGYQEVGPRDPDTNVPLGGRYLLETALEARVRVRDKISVVGFIDGGNVGQDELPSAGDLRFGAGLGVRYDTIAGPIRFDIATPLDRRSGEDAVQIYISIGQAF
jgi:translocation and assembly module TamA